MDFCTFFEKVVHLFFNFSSGVDRKNSTVKKTMELAFGEELTEVIRKKMNFYITNFEAFEQFSGTLIFFI